jgi:hypothetical protein
MECLVVVGGGRMPPHMGGSGRCSTTHVKEVVADSKGAAQA